MTPLPFERFWRRLDPRTSIAARLLLGFFLAFLLPGCLFVFLTQRRLSSLQAASAEQVAAVRVAETEMRTGQDVAFRAEWIDRRARVTEESAWALADAAALALSAPAAEEPSRLAVDREGRLWTEIPEEDSVAIVSSRATNADAARRDAVRLRSLAPLMARLRERRPSVHGVAVWTVSGALRANPWVDFARADRAAAAELDRFVLHPDPGFPPSRPATGDEALWVGLPAEPSESAADGRRLATMIVPVRDEAGRLLGGIALDVDPRRYVAEAFETWEPVGDFWLATDAAGRAITMTPRAAAVLGWSSTGGANLSDAASPELKRLALKALKSPRSAEQYLVDGQSLRITSARVPATGWVLFEGLSGEAVATIQAEAVRAFPPASYSGLKRDLLLLFALLALAVLGAVGIVSRRISAPVETLVHAAEDVGRGRAVDLSPAAPDEIGRLAAAIGAMSQRVTRRVETLRRLHAFSRSAYRMTDVTEVLGRSTQAIAAFTGAERVWFQLYDRNTNRLEAALPSWNVSEDMASKLRVSVDARSIAGLVFRTGETYCSNDLDHDPYSNRDIDEIVGARNGVLVPLKTEEETLGVAVAINRPDGFGQEEVDAVTSFADLASLLLRNARLYGTLTATVDELRHASRLKDHFLQNVNHELRTPLTAIVGWTDLFEEEEIDEKTLKRGLRQIRQSARVLLALIDDLLDLARLERGALTLDLKLVSLSEVIQRSVETVRLMAESRGVVLILAPQPEPMPPVRADALRVQQILWNLLSNAIQFTPQHGRVVIRVEREPERYLVSVEDDGIGIPESELPHVFERFRQVDGSATRGHAGMGIGLALARSLVELHGGTIWASSVVGQGSRFTFALPIRPAERRAVETPAAAGARERA